MNCQYNRKKHGLFWRKKETNVTPVTPNISIQPRLTGLPAAPSVAAQNPDERLCLLLGEWFCLRLSSGLAEWLRPDGFEAPGPQPAGAFIDGLVEGIGADFLDLADDSSGH